MWYSNEELMDLFDFILENKSITISDTSLFSRDILTNIRAIVKGKVINNFELTSEQQELIINTFINSNKGFDEYTPSLIKRNLACIKHALFNDINSADYIYSPTIEIEKYVVSEILKNNFVLKNISPRYLISNYDVVLNSISLNPLSANFVLWDFMDDKQTKLLTELALNRGYILSLESPFILRNNLEIVLQSIKKDINNIIYATEDIKNHPKVFEYLMLNDYEYPPDYIRSRGLNNFSNIDVFAKTLEKLDHYNYKNLNNECKSRYNKIYFDAINTYPTIKTFDSVFESVASFKWEKHRSENRDAYDNIFGKILAELRHMDNLDDAVDNLSFLNDMEEKLLYDKYKILYDAMSSYFNIFHSDTKNKVKKLGTYKDIISDLSRLYVSKSKEAYKKDISIVCYQWLKNYFTIRLDNKEINKKIILARKKQIFSELYLKKDEDIRKFIDEIIKKYSKDLNQTSISALINGFIYNNSSKISEIISPPSFYYDYERYKKASKLINRLNNNYIKYDGIEVHNYLDIIGYDTDLNEYVYQGYNFTQNDLNKFEEYNSKKEIFEKIKREIYEKIELVDYDNQVDSALIEELKSSIPFNDEYFKFDESQLKFYSIRNLFAKNLFKYYDMNLLTSDEQFKNIKNLLINNGLIWLVLFLEKKSCSVLADTHINSETICDIIGNMSKILNLSKALNINIDNFKDLDDINEICSCCDSQTMFILGKDVIKKLFEDMTSNDDDLLEKAKELVCQMTKKDKSTVPYVSGEVMEYKYSLYDSQDPSILVSGIDTDACFRIDGVDNDFFHYCALNKNGFVIKITDKFDNFIARASGFRNGNCVFINQLRTIYDESGNIYNGEYTNEKNNIIEVFEKACKDIVKSSRENPKEKNKIDYVFVNQCYILDDYGSNVDEEVSDEIGDFPMEADSEDWQNFVDNTKNLWMEDELFETDYGTYELICMARRIRNIRPELIKMKDVEAIYERKRNKIVITNECDINLYQKVNRIEAIKSYLDEEEFALVNFFPNSITFIGDNWYIIYNNGAIVNSCLLDFDKKAKIEFEVTKRIIEEQFTDKEVIENNYEILNNTKDNKIKKMLNTVLSD